jgi:hypothetical protein
MTAAAFRQNHTDEQPDENPPQPSGIVIHGSQLFTCP